MLQKHLKQLKKIFGPPDGTTASGQSRQHTLNWLDYPKLHQGILYVSGAPENLELDYPDICCVCGVAKEGHRDVEFRTGIFSTTVFSRVPFCPQHNPDRLPRFYAFSAPISPVLLKVGVISESAMFIESLLQRYATKTPLAPWLAFPGLSAESSGWRQGDAEHWWNTCWRPYWTLLSQDKRDEILLAESTPLAWRERLNA